MAVVTKLSVQDIQLALYRSQFWNNKQDLYVPNVPYGMFGHEIDLAIMNNSGYITEIAIKRSWDEFISDFKKGFSHDDERVSFFAYCVPEKIIDKVCKYIVSNFKNYEDEPAVLYYNEDGNIAMAPIGFIRRPGKHRSLFLEEIYQLAKLGVFRYWELLNDKKKDN